MIDEIIEKALSTILSKDPFAAYLSYEDLGLFDVGSAIDKMDSPLDSILILSLPLRYPLISLPTLG